VEYIEPDENWARSLQNIELRHEAPESTKVKYLEAAI